MLYSDLQTAFQSILNRRDITPTQLSTFMSLGIQRIQTEVRMQAMENIVQYVCDGTPSIQIPGDYLEMIALNTCDPVNHDKLVRVDLGTILPLTFYPGIPKKYSRQGGAFILGPCPIAGTIVTLTYYQDASSLVNPTDHNWITDAVPQLLIYAALSYAADFYLDERAQSFEQRYLQIKQSVMDMATQDELANASIQPMAYVHDGYPDYC